MSSTPSKMAESSSFSIPPRGPRRWRIANPCAELPSCIKCRTTPLFLGPSPRRRESKPISGGTSRCVRCKAISAVGPHPGNRGKSSDGTCLGHRFRVARPDATSARDLNYCLLIEIGGLTETDGQDPDDGGGLFDARERAQAPPAGRAAPHHPADH